MTPWWESWWTWTGPWPIEGHWRIRDERGMIVGGIRGSSAFDAIRSWRLAHPPGPPICSAELTSVCLGTTEFWVHQ